MAVTPKGLFASGKVRDVSKSIEVLIGSRPLRLSDLLESLGKDPDGVKSGRGARKKEFPIF